MVIHVPENELPCMTRRDAREQAGQGNTIGTTGARDEQRSALRRDFLTFENGFEIAFRMGAAQG